MTFASMHASASTSTLALSEWSRTRKCQEWVPDPFSAFHATLTWYYRNADANADADAHANVMCKQSFTPCLRYERENDLLRINYQEKTVPLSFSVDSFDHVFELV